MSLDFVCSQWGCVDQDVNPLLLHSGVGELFLASKPPALLLKET